MQDKMLDHLFGDMLEPASQAEQEQRARELKELDEAGIMPQDDEPRVWADEHPELTEREMRLGEALGKDIDIDDDEDNGGIS